MYKEVSNMADVKVKVAANSPKVEATVSQTTSFAGERKFTVQDILGNPEAFGSEAAAVAGAFYGKEEQTFTRNEAKAEIKKFLNAKATK